RARLTGTETTHCELCAEDRQVGSSLLVDRCGPIRRDRPKEVDVTETRRTTTEEARRVGDAIGVDWSRFDLEQFRARMDVEFEHGSHDPQTDVTHDDPIVTGKIALAHMKEFPDYYERLELMEQEAERYWSGKRS